MLAWIKHLYYLWQTGRAGTALFGYRIGGAGLVPCFNSTVELALVVWEQMIWPCPLPDAALGDLASEVLES